MSARRFCAAALWCLVPVSLAAAQQSSWLHFADIDGDGLDDALVIEPSGGVSLLANRGEGRFEEATARSGLSQVDFASCALFADFDGDGHVDLFVGSSEQRLWRNDGKGVFSAMPSGVEHDLVDLEARALDHDRDGRLDLVLHTEAGDLFYRNAPTGRFERVELPDTDHPARSLALDSNDSADDDTNDAAAHVSAARKRYRRWLALRANTTPSNANAGSNSSSLLSTPGMSSTSAGPLGLAGAPTMICAGTIVDQASGMCIEASSVGVLGELYPLSNDFFVDSANSRVGVGTATPLYTLHVAGKLVSGVNTSASGLNAAVGGGASNSSSASHATVAGGESNTAGHSHGFIGGGLFNATAGTRSVIGGGISNRAGNSAVVGGGSNNEANFNFSTVAGGRLNKADATYAAIVGGASNSITGLYAFIGGGGEDNVPASGNVASGLASAIVGGRSNLASGDRASIGGGSSNQATSQHTSIAGGRANSVFGAYGAIPGGELNVAAGSHSLAAGRRAKALHDGSFVWGDSTNADFSSTAPNQFLIRASGGVGIDRVPDPAMKLDVAGTIRASDTIVSSKSVGAPLAVASSDLNTNLNADLLDGFHASAFSMLGSQIETAEIADSAVTSNKIANATITNADISSSAAIAGSKVAPNFGAQDVVTTGRVAIGTTTLGEQLTVAGVIESTSGGVKFPDGSVQATAQLVGPQGPAGPQGPQGPQGPPGPTEPPEPTQRVGQLQFFNGNTPIAAATSIFEFEMWHAADVFGPNLPAVFVQVTRKVDAQTALLLAAQNGSSTTDVEIVLENLGRTWGPATDVVRLKITDIVTVNVEHRNVPQNITLMNETVTFSGATLEWDADFGGSSDFNSALGTWSNVPFQNSPLRYSVRTSNLSQPPPAGVDYARDAEYSRSGGFGGAPVRRFEVYKPLSIDTAAMLRAAQGTVMPLAFQFAEMRVELTNVPNGPDTLEYRLLNPVELVDWRIETHELLLREVLVFEQTGGGGGGAATLTINGAVTNL